MPSPPKHLQDAIVSRVKIMAEMNIAERYVPQDGHIELEPRRARGGRARGDDPDDLRRVGGAAPARQGRVPLRPRAGRDSRRIISRASGTSCALRTASCSSAGRPAAGKTTTLYAALNDIYTSERRFITDRGSGRVRADRREPDPRAPEARADLRQRAARDPAAGPGHHHGRRNPRPRDGRHRDAFGADRPPGAQLAAHERRGRSPSRG